MFQELPRKFGVTANPSAILNPRHFNPARMAVAKIICSEEADSVFPMKQNMEQQCRGGKFAVQG